MTEEQACCACLAVTYQPVHFEDGSMRERWCCTSCGAVFVKQGIADHQIRLLKEQLSIWKRKAGDNQLVAGRYQYLFEEAMKAVNKVDDLFEYVYTSMHPTEIRKAVYTALSTFTEATKKVRRSPTDDPES